MGKEGLHTQEYLHPLREDFDNKLVISEVVFTDNIAINTLKNVFIFFMNVNCTILFLEKIKSKKFQFMMRLDLLFLLDFLFQKTFHH